MYTHTLNGMGVVDSGGKFVPFDEGNQDYQQYLQWLEAGNSPMPFAEPAVAAPTVESLMAEMQELARKLQELQTTE